MTGWKPEGCSKFIPTREEFLSENNGIWQYGQTYSTTTPNVELSEEEQLVLLKKITTESAYGNTVTEKEVA